MTIPRQALRDIVNLKQYPLSDTAFQEQCKRVLDNDGVLLLTDFIHTEVVQSIKQEGLDHQHLAYYTADTHNIYLTPTDSNFSDSHPLNRQINSSKGCITDDQISPESALQTLYHGPQLKRFLANVLGEKELHPYADSLSSINLHYASEGQELGWHFDNSSFAITLLIEKPKAGGEFEYVKDVRDADAGEMNFDLAEKILDGEYPVQTLQMQPGSLVLFRGRNSMHRVTPTIGNITRMLVVLAYNTKPGISLSESARMTFFGRLK